jgi:hypothetical protein
MAPRPTHPCRNVEGRKSINLFLRNGNERTGRFNLSINSGVDEGSLWFSKSLLKVVVRIFGRGFIKKKKRSFSKVCLEDQRFNDTQVHLLIVFVYAMMFLETSRRFLFTDHSFFHLTFSLVLTNRKKNCPKSGRWCNLTVITESRLPNILYPSS